MALNSRSSTKRNANDTITNTRSTRARIVPTSEDPIPDPTNTPEDPITESHPAPLIDLTSNPTLPPATPSPIPKTKIPPPPDSTTQDLSSTTEVEDMSL